MNDDLSRDSMEAAGFDGEERAPDAEADAGAAASTADRPAPTPRETVPPDEGQAPEDHPVEAAADGSSAGATSVTAGESAPGDASARATNGETATGEVANGEAATGDDDTASDDGDTADAADDDEVSAPSLALGSTFHHYRVEAELGRGGMGIVYKAHHQGLNRTVALKLLLAGAFASAEARRRFLREAEAAGALQHPFIVPILDAGEHEGIYFITMAYVPGEPLTAFARRKGERRELLELFTRVCEGVHHAHARGVVHRDLKPDNVLVGEGGDPHILDFGIAKRLDGEETKGLTVEGDILGTLRYMPPEQAAGRVQDVDVRSDVYALGSILYELLCGRTPFTGNAHELLNQIHFEPPRPPSVSAGDLPWELDSICLKALEKDRDERYQSALELKQDVLRFLAGEPIRARRATLTYRLWKWAHRNRSQAAAAALGLVGLLTVLIGGLAAHVAAERRHRDLLLAASRAGWERFASLDVQGALDEFNGARERARPDDLLPIPKDLETLVPRELLGEGGARLTRDRLNEWADYARDHLALEQGNELLREARRALADGRLNAASHDLQLVGRLAPRHQHLPALRRDVALALVAEGRTWVESKAPERRTSEPPHEAAAYLERRQGELARARVSFEEAQRLDPSGGAALEALTGLHQELGKLEELRQALALQEKERVQARRLADEGARCLEANALEAARRAFEQALAFDGSAQVARDGLARVEGLLAEARLEEQRRQELAKAAGLADEARLALRRGDLEAARARFLQALAFDGASPVARAGLDEVYRREQAREREELKTAKLREADVLLRDAKQELERGRALFREGALPEAVREPYFAALDALQRALFAAPDYALANLALSRTCKEFSLVLVEQGQPELSRFMLRLGRVDPQATADVQLPRDPHLTLVEANRVNIRRAYGSEVRFMPSGAFEGLRARIQAQGDRYRATVEVLTEVVRRSTAHPQIFVRGLQVRLEDRQASTVYPPVRVPFEGGPYERQVIVDGQGRRLVRPFEVATGLDARPYVAQVEALVEGLMARPR